MNDSNININRGFQKLEVWREAMDLYLFIKTKVRDLNNVPLKIRGMVEASAFYCHAQIAERYSWRRGSDESNHRNKAALASLAENYSQVTALLESGDIDKEWFDEYDAKHLSVENKLISFSKEYDSVYKDQLLDDWNVEG